MRILRKEIDLAFIFLFSSLFFIGFYIPEAVIGQFSFEIYIIGISIIFLLSSILFYRYDFQNSILVLVFFLLFTIFKTEASFITTALLFLCVPFYLNRNALKDYGLNKFKFNFLIYGIFSVFLVILTVGIIGMIFQFFGMNDQENVKETVLNFPLIAIPFAVIFAPLSEEIFFRGFLLKKYGVWISALIFALLHFGYGSIVQVVASFAIALIFSYIFIKTKSLWPVIITHSFFNLIALTVMWFL